MTATAMRNDEMTADNAARSDGAVAPEARAAGVKDWLVLLLLTAAMMFSYVDRFTFALLLEPIKHALHATDAQLGLINGVAFGLFFAVMGVPLGWLADRWSRKGTIMLAMSVWSAATACCGLASGYMQLFLCRIAVGSGEAGLSPSSYGLIHDRFPRTRLALALSISQLGANVGLGVAFAGAGAAYALFQAGALSDWPIIGPLQAWQKTFIAVALPGIPLLALLALMGEPKRRAEPVDAAPSAKLTLRQVRGFVLTFLAFSGSVMTSNALVGWTPALLAREHHWTPAFVGSTYGLIVMIAGAAGILVGGWFCDRRMQRNNHGDHLEISFWSVVLVLPLMIGEAFCSNATVLMVLAAMMHFLLSLPYGVLPAYIQLKAPAAARGQISALYVMVVNGVAQGLGPSLVGFVSGLRPDEPTALRSAIVWVTVPALAVTMTSLFLIARRERRARPPQTAAQDAPRDPGPGVFSVG
jgi:MFS family permease